MEKQGLYTVVLIPDDEIDDYDGSFGQWVFNEFTDEGTELKEKLYTLNYLEEEDFRKNEKYTVDYWPKKEKIADIIDKDISKTLGYDTTINIHNDGSYLAFDNEEFPGEWVKK